MRFVLRKGGPYYGPRGGKWADPEHTIPWKKPHSKALFHSAPVEHMESIKEHGLTPRQGAGLFNHGSYAEHSQGKVFLSEHFTAAKNWHEKVSNMLEHHHDDPKMHDAVMLRVKHRKTELDEVGDRDVEGSRYSNKAIPPEDLEYFDKKHGWRPIEHWEPRRHKVPDEKRALHPGKEAERILEQRKAKEASDAAARVESEKQRAAYEAEEAKEVAEWAEKTVAEREAKAKELLSKKSIIPGHSHLNTRWQRVLNVDSRGLSKDAVAVHEGATYEVRPHEALGMRGFKLKIEKVGAGTALVSFDGGSTTPVPVESVPHLVNDLQGRVIAKPSEHHPINMVLNGDAKFLGKGDDGLAFKAGRQVVKVSTTVPYQPSNAFHKTPERAVAVARQQHETQAAMRAAGVPGLLSEQFVEHDGRGYTIRPHVEIPEKLSEAQLEKVHDAIEAMHKKGWVLGDEVQVGLHDGEPVLFDVGKAEKSDSAIARDRDGDRLAELYRKHGVEYTPRGANLEKQWESKLTHARAMKTAPIATRQKIATQLRKLAEGRHKGAPDELEREIIADDLKQALEMLGMEKARFTIDLSKAARKLHRRREFQGLLISVENQTGSYRKWYSEHEKKHGKTLMQNDYGYIRRTKGTDGDHVDVYVGPNKDAKFAYVISQMCPPDFLEIDEQKVMLGFDSLHDAAEAYKAHYDDERFCGEVRTVPMADFKAYVLDPENHGELIKGYVVMRGTAEQSVPDFQAIWGIGDTTELEKKQNKERMEQSSKRNSGRFGFHGEAGGKPTLRYQQVDFPHQERLGKAEKGSQVSGHKYIRRVPNGRGGWYYIYSEGTMAPGGGGGAPVPTSEKHTLPMKPVARPSLDMLTSLEGVKPYGDEQRANPGRVKSRKWITAKTLGLPSDTKHAHAGETGEYSPERQEFHKSVISKFTDHVKPVPKDRKPTAIVTMGGPASGKGSILKTLIGDHNDFVLSDPDACKEELPEYKKAVMYGEHEGSVVSAVDAAAMAHEESSDLADAIRDQAIRDRKNVIVDGTGKNSDKFIGRIQALQKAGYHVQLVLPHVPMKMAMERAQGRAKGTGRYVPDEIVEQAHHLIPGNFEKIARVVDEFALFDNKTEPRVVWSGGKDQPDAVHDPDFVQQFRKAGEVRHRIARKKGWMKSFRLWVRRYV